MASVTMAATAFAAPGRLAGDMPLLKVARPKAPAVSPLQLRASRQFKVYAASWQKASTKEAIETAGGKLVVEVGGQKVLLVEDGGKIYSVSNKCSHLGLPLVGKTALFQGKVANTCIVCPAHNTAFDLATGQVKGEWCPNFPNLPLIGKGTPEKPLPVFENRVDEAGNVEVLV